MRLTSPIPPMRMAARRLRRDRSGVAMLEFAFAMPLVMGVGIYGIESANLALANMRISQIALNLADNASRVGTSSGLATQQMREIDVIDVLDAVREQGRAIELPANGRITLSSLERIDGTQRIHWQRCLGLKSGAGFDSSYGTTKATDGTDNTPATAGTPAADGMGPDGSKVDAPDDSGVMFVEVNYIYKPVVGAWVYGRPRLHYTASFIVRDRRDFRQIYNPAPAATPMTCDRHTV